MKDLTRAVFSNSSDIFHIIDNNTGKTLCNKKGFTETWIKTFGRRICKHCLKEIKISDPVNYEIYLKYL